MLLYMLGIDNISVSKGISHLYFSPFLFGPYKEEEKLGVGKCYQSPGLDVVSISSLLCLLFLLEKNTSRDRILRHTLPFSKFIGYYLETLFQT